MIKKISGLIKPCYVFKPTSLIRRLTLGFSSKKAGMTELVLPWRSTIAVDPSETIGGDILKQGIFDIAVSECAWRLIQPGDKVLDVGANIGYMTSLFAARAGRNGKVHSFEPHPVIRKKLEANVVRFANNKGSAPIEVHPLALGSRIETAHLVETDYFETNQGTATLTDQVPQAALPPGVILHPVQVETLDHLFPTDSFSLLKIDVEGNEAKVIEGAPQLLKDKRISNVIYEDHERGKTGLPEVFTRFGYSVFSIGYTLSGLELRTPDQPVALDTSWESVNYLATTRPEEVRALLGKGWRVLRGS